MQIQLRTVALSAILLGALASCSKSDSERSKTQAPTEAVQGAFDLSKHETWIRKKRPFEAHGRVTIVTTVSPAASLEKKCTMSESCLCLTPVQLAIRELGADGQVTLMSPSETNDGNREFYPCNSCSGECPLPLGEAEVVGTLFENTFQLSKLPTYLDGRPAVPTHALGPDGAIPSVAKP